MDSRSRPEAPPLMGFEPFPVQLEEQKQRNLTMTGMAPPKMDSEFLRMFQRFQTSVDRKDLIYTAGNTVANRVYCSTSPLGSLKRISIAEMKINIPAKNSYLLLRTLEKPYRICGIMTIVEDHTGEVFKFAVYNMASENLNEEPDDIFPIGTVFALKEPFLKPSLEGGFLIRCDSPSDIHFIKRHHRVSSLFLDILWINHIEIPENEELPVSLLGWKQKGNTLFRQKKYTKALEAYFTALSLCSKTNDEMSLILNSNLAATYLELGYFESALECCALILDKDSVNFKALYRAGRAHYELRHYEEAETYFKNVLKLERNNSESKVLLEKCSARLLEQKGNICIEKLYLASIQNRKKCIDCADYVNGMKRASGLNEDRYVVATCDITPGTLLLVSKAISVVYKNEKDQTRQHLVADKTCTGMDAFQLVTELTLAVLKNPNTFGALIYELPINDAFLNYVKPKRFCDEETKSEPICDVERIRKIVVSNAVRIEPYSDSVDEKDNNGLGLFLFPSYMKHSCLANTNWVTFNNVFVMHATQHIKAGEEITISRLSPFMPFSTKEKIFESWEEQCECDLCKLDRKDPKKLRLQRESYSSLITEYFYRYAKSNESFESKLVTDVSDIVMNIEDIYRKSHRTELRYDLILAYSCLAVLHFKTYPLSRKTLKLLTKAICASGFTLETMPNCFKENFEIPKNALMSTFSLLPVQFLVKYFYEQKKHKEARKWLKVLESAECILSGASIGMLPAKYNQISDSAYQDLKK